MKRSCIIILITICFLADIFGEVIYVDGAASGTGDGSTWGNAFTYIQDAIALSEYGDTIQISKGEYYVNDGGDYLISNIDVSIVVPNGVKILGGYDSQSGDRNVSNNPTVINGFMEERVFFAPKNHILLKLINTENNTLVDGITFLNGSATGSNVCEGAAIYCEKSSSIIKNCVFKDNYAITFGGCIYLDECGDMLIKGCEFYDNYAHAGAGIYFNFSHDCRVEECEFYDNESRYSGAIHFWESDASILNCCIYGNIAEYSGGAIHLYKSCLSMEYCTISGNYSESTAAIVFEECEDKQSSISNSIIWNNDSSGTAQISENACLTVSYSNVQGCNVSEESDGYLWNTSYGNDGGGNFDTDPLFVMAYDPLSAPCSDGDYHLSEGSPCIAAACDEDTVNSDLSAVSRPQPAAALNSDLGAYEYCEEEIPLSISLGAISLEELSEGVCFRWETHSEIENAGFIIEVSSDSLVWDILYSYHEEESLKGKGTISSQQSYHCSIPYEALENKDIIRLSCVNYSGDKEILYTRRTGYRRLSSRIKIARTHPNPFNPSVIFDLELSRNEYVSAKIYDSRGRCVDEIFHGEIRAGDHSLIWTPAHAASGVYFCIIETSEDRLCEKILFIR